MSRKKCTSSRLRKRAAAMEWTGAERRQTLAPRRAVRKVKTHHLPSCTRDMVSSHQREGEKARRTKLTARRRNLRPCRDGRSIPCRHRSGRTRDCQSLSNREVSESRDCSNRVERTEVGPEMLWARGQSCPVQWKLDFSSRIGCKSPLCHRRSSRGGCSWLRIAEPSS